MSFKLNIHPLRIALAKGQIIVISHELQDPNTDLQAIRIASSGLVYSGKPQIARNLAEHGLMLIDHHPAAIGWRTVQSWATYADAMHRSGNFLRSLQYLGLCILAWEEPAANYTLLTSTLRIAARIFRDVGFLELALNLIHLEREWTLQNGDHPQKLLELQQMELTLQMKRLGTKASGTDLLSLLEKSRELLEMSIGYELAPILVVQAQLIRRLRIAHVPIPAEIITQFVDELDKLPEQQKKTIELYSHVSPQKTDLLDAIRRASFATSWDDLAYQMQPVHLLALNAIEDAASHNDYETFLIAATLLSQPVSSLWAWESTEQVRAKDTFRAHEWFLKQISATNNQAELTDAAQIEAEVIQPQNRSIDQIENISTSQLQSIIHPDELIIVLCQDESGCLCRALISAEAILDIQRLPDNIWSKRRYEIWKSSYPRGYGNWEPPTPLQADRLSPDVFRETLDGLSVGPLPNYPSVTVLPDSDLFGFPIDLGSDNNSFLKQQHQIATSPSATWLIEARRRAWSGGLNKTAWLGSPNTPDLSLHLLRERLQPSFVQYGVQVIDRDLPDGMNASALALIVAHGSLGHIDQFQFATDSVRTYSSQELAAALNGCGCVVLFVCHSGRADEQYGTAETVGLVTQLITRLLYFDNSDQS